LLDGRKLGVVISGDRHRARRPAQRIAHGAFVLAGALQQTQRRFVVVLADQVVDDGEVEVELDDVAGRELAML
jgi:hypothetical protein